MKILKKIGIGFLALIICLASTIPKIKAYDFNNFVASSTTSGTILYRPLLNATLNRVSTQGSTTYYSYPLTQQFYHNATLIPPVKYNEIFDSNLELRYRLYAIQNGTNQLIRVNDNINELADTLQFPYKSTNVEYFDTSTNSIDRFELTIDYNYFFASDLFWSLELIGSNISGSVDVKYIVEGYDLNNTFKTIVYETTAVFETNSCEIDYDPYDNINDFNMYGFGYIIPSRYSVQIKPSTDFVGDFSSINHYVYNTVYVDNSNHSLITQFLLSHFNVGNSTPTPPLDNSYDFTSWLVNSVGSFMNFEIFPGFQLSTMLGVVVAIPLLIYILKFFMGG